VIDISLHPKQWWDYYCYSVDKNGLTFPYLENINSFSTKYKYSVATEINYTWL
jgi:hypothetical protein